MAGNRLPAGGDALQAHKVKHEPRTTVRGFYSPEYSPVSAIFAAIFRRPAPNVSRETSRP